LNRFNFLINFERDWGCGFNFERD